MSITDLSIVVIDTNILLLLLGYQCLEFENAKPLKRAQVLGDIRGRGDGLSPERFDDLWLIFQRAERRIITQHVVAETYGLRGRLPHAKELIWRSAIKILADPGTEEQPCSIRELSQNREYDRILSELGPTDAGLLFTASRNNAALLTDDGELIHWAYTRSVPAIPLTQIGLM